MRAMVREFFHSCEVSCPNCGHHIKLPEPRKDSPEGFNRVACALCMKERKITEDDLR